MLLVIDNFDSFTYNLVQYFGELGADPQVFRNEAITLDEIDKCEYTGIVISPGPGTPGDAGISIPAIRRFAGKIPILGVCLGHQAIGEAFGGRVVRAPRPIHGKSCRSCSKSCGRCWRPNRSSQTLSSSRIRHSRRVRGGLCIHPRRLAQ